MKLFLVFYLRQYDLGASERFKDFDWAQKALARDEIEEKLGYYLQKDERIGSFFTVG
jgi:hypothetical protein